MAAASAIVGKDAPALEESPPAFDEDPCVGALEAVGRDGALDGRRVAATVVIAATLVTLATALVTAEENVPEDKSE